MRRRVILLLKLRWRDYLLLLRLYYLLHLAKWQIEYKSLKQIRAWIKREDIAERRVDEAAFAYAKKVGRYTDRLAKYTLYKSKCYDRALAVKQELNRKQIPSALVMGLETRAADGLRAHAWLRCRERIIVGRGVAPDYTALRHFY